jgi:hypothetical protein
MATVLEEYTAKDQCSVLWTKLLSAKVIHKDFLFTFGSVWPIISAANQGAMLYQRLFQYPRIPQK